MWFQKFLIGLSILLYFSLFTKAQERNFRVVTVFQAPFAYKDNATGENRGFLVELLNDMGRLGRFNYTLKGLDFGKNSMFDNYPSLLINEVVNGKADIALSLHLFKAENYFRYVNFSQPYLTSGLSALVRKSVLQEHGIDNLPALLKKTKTARNEINNSLKNKTDDSVLSQNQSFIELGTVRQSAAYRIITTSRDSLTGSVHESLVSQNQDALADDEQAAIQKVFQKPYAFVQEAFQNELIAAKNCSLTHLLLKLAKKNVKSSQNLEYSFAVNKANLTDVLPIVDQAIDMMRGSGLLEQLERKYWKNECQPFRLAELLVKEKKPSGAKSIGFYASLVIVLVSLMFSLIF